MSEVKNLVDEFEFSYADVALVAGKSPSLMRRWARDVGGPAGDDEIAEVRRLLSVVAVVKKFIGRDQIARWMRSPVLPGTDVTPMQLFLDGNDRVIIDIAKHPQITTTISRYMTPRSAVVEHDDGTTTIVCRETHRATPSDERRNAEHSDSASHHVARYVSVTAKDAEAVRYIPGETCDVLASWTGAASCDPGGCDSDLPFVLNQDGEVYPGDWVVRENDGTMYVLNDEEFSATFRMCVAPTTPEIRSTDCS